MFAIKLFSLIPHDVVCLLPSCLASLFNDIKLFVVVSFVFLFFSPSSEPCDVGEKREGSEKHFYGTWGDDVLYGSGLHDLLIQSIKEVY
jgi:hypothetical protein